VSAVSVTPEFFNRESRCWIPAYNRENHKYNAMSMFKIDSIEPIAHNC